MADSVGINRRTGRIVSDWAHVCQSIGDLLSTPYLTRVMRREYGSAVPDVIDKPLTNASLLEFYVAAAEALDRWEPRFSLDKIELVSATRGGRIELALEGTYRPRAHKGDMTPAEIPDRSIAFMLANDGWRAL